MVSPSYSNQHQPDIYFTPALQAPYNLSLTIASELSSKLLAHNWWTSARRLESRVICCDVVLWLFYHEDFADSNTMFVPLLSLVLRVRYL